MTYEDSPQVVEGEPEGPFERARRRKSAWNLLLPIAFFPSWVLSWRVSFLVASRLHAWLYPGQDWGNTGPGIGRALAMFAPLFGTIPLAFLATNVVLWLIPPARRAFDREAEGHPGTSFREAQSQLIVATLYISPVCAVAGLLGTVLRW